ncbi:hypothetical protein CJO94_23345 (plasmid) [Ralstonia solanacearum]|nr:hypothetical protein CJO94_23345 [Ralstonia solanacearum]
MKIGCKCGAVIYDQSDFLPDKAHLIADQDWEDFAESASRSEGLDGSLTRTCYQCGSCGRLYVEDADRQLRAFVPEEASGPLLTSSRGLAWKAPLIGAWTDKPLLADRPKGSLWCHSEHAKDLPQEYDSWAALEAAYFALFYRLQAQGALRSALLRKNGDTVHVWPRHSRG